MTWLFDCRYDTALPRLLKHPFQRERATLGIEHLHRHASADSQRAGRLCALVTDERMIARTLAE